jgi:nuclear migration protein JNM1
VYETPNASSDVRDSSSPSGPSLHNPDIDESTLSMNEASQRFCSKRVYLSSGLTADETVEEKIARLKREVEEVKQELVNDGLQEQLVGLQAILDELKISKRNEPKLYRELGQIPNVDIPSHEISDTNAYNSLTTLESRLTALEERVGVESVYSEPKPISVMLNDLQRKVSLLTSNPTALQTAVTNLKEIITLISTVKNSGSGKSPLPTQMESKINQLYEKLPVINNISGTVPVIIERLKSLQGVHTDASDVRLTVRDMDATIDDLKMDVKKWMNSLEAVEEKIRSFGEKTELNKSELDKWLTKIEHRVNTTE